MPDPRQGESEDNFVSRCIPIVMREGTAENGSQAAAICHSMWRNRKMEDLMKQVPEPRDGESRNRYVDRCSKYFKDNYSGLRRREAEDICTDLYAQATKSKKPPLREPARFGAGQALGQRGRQSVSILDLDEMERQLRENTTPGDSQEPRIATNPGRPQRESILGTGLTRGEKLRQP